jgi:excisionase family DNA binding protein
MTAPCTIYRFPASPIDLLTVPEAAAYLRISTNALRIAISRGQIPGVVRIGGRVRINREALRKHCGEKPAC